jgi:hypothetical protein
MVSPPDRGHPDRRRVPAPAGESALRSHNGTGSSTRRDPRKGVRSSHRSKIHSMECTVLRSAHATRTVPAESPMREAVPELRQLFSELIRFETELWNAIDARLRAECDLPLSRFEPLQVISRLEACRVNDIAAELAITVGGTSKLVDRIEASGYCRRRSNQDDRRSSFSSCTSSRLGSARSSLTVRWSSSA